MNAKKTQRALSLALPLAALLSCQGPHETGPAQAPPGSLASGGVAPAPAVKASADTEATPAPAKEAAPTHAKEAMSTHDAAAKATEASSSRASEAFARPGFSVFEVDGRLWVFRDGDAEIEEFLRNGPPSEHVTRVGAGPGGRTIKAVDADTILAYLATKPGFETRIVDGRVWVFRVGDPELAEFDRQGAPSEHVTRIGVGPLGSTLKSPDSETIDSYIYAKPGYRVVPLDGRLWIFREGSEALAEFEKNGEPSERVVRPGAGPGGLTVEAVENEVLDGYAAACEGFTTFVIDGRIWVFRPGSDALREFQEHGEPTECVTLVAAGPNRMTVKSSDRDVIEEYLRAVRR